MDLIGLVGIAASLFLVIGLSEPLAARMGLPYSVILAGVGILIGIGATFVLNTTLTDALNPIAQTILDLPIRSNVFLYVFLPTLLFQVSLGLNLRRMLDDWVPILVLAAVAVIVATVMIGFALKPVSTLPLAACLLIGAIVSTTDPSAVVSIFRSISAPQRLIRIVEGESLLNDAAAIALFGLFLGLVRRGSEEVAIGGALLQFPWLIGGGLIAGLLIARVAIWLMAHMWRHPTAQMSISVALPYLAYLAAEQLAGASGVIAVVAAGLALNLMGPARLTPVIWAELRELWGLLAHWAGSLIFVLAALLIPKLLAETRVSDLGLVATVTAAAIAARAVILFGLLPVLSRLNLSPVIERPFRVTILWGGLRGAVTLALALSVTESFFIPAEIKRQVGILATGFTLFTLIAQGATLKMVIRGLGLDRLSPIDTALSNQVIAVALQNVREDMAEAATRYDLSHDIVRAEAKAFGERLEGSVKEAEEGAEILDRDRITLGLLALAGRERELILEGFREKIVSAELVERMLSDADRVIERTRARGRIEYLVAARRALGYGPGYRFAVFLQTRLRISFLVARYTADRFEILLTQRLNLRDLHGFIDAKIRRIHGRRVADLLHDLLERREEETAKALEGLQLQFPGYAEQLERRFIRRTVLRLEEREYDGVYADGLVGPELYGTLSQQIERTEAQVTRRPKLDLAVQKADLIREFPLFAKIELRQRRKLARALTTRFAVPDEELQRKGDVPKTVYFIASGAVEVEAAGHVTRLGQGEMFGQLTLLTGRTSRTHVTAITHCTLLGLSEARFLRLLERSEPLRKAVLESAAKRGMKLAQSLPATAPRPSWFDRFRKTKAAPGTDPAAVAEAKPAVTPEPSADLTPATGPAAATENPDQASSPSSGSASGAGST